MHSKLTSEIIPNSIQNMIGSTESYETRAEEVIAFGTEFTTSYDDEKGKVEVTNILAFINDSNYRGMGGRGLLLLFR